MAYRLAPYNESMQLGQGVDSFTQQIRTKEPVAIPTTITLKHLLNNLSIDEEGETSHANDRSISTPTSSRWEHLSDAVDQESAQGSLPSYEGSKPTVTRVAYFVNNASEVTALMGLSGAAATLAYTQTPEAHGRLFNFQQFFDADLNYLISVRAVKREVKPFTHFCVKPPLDRLNERDRFGDTFISGFLEGGQLDALVSLKLRDNQFRGQDKQAEIIAAMEAIFQLDQDDLDEPTSLDAAFQTLAETSKITIQTRRAGQMTNTGRDQARSLSSLRNMLLEFPASAAAQPTQISAILSTYDSIRHSEGPTPPSASLVRFDEAFLHANTLFDAYMEFRDIKQALSAQIWGIRAGTVEFEPMAVTAPPDEYHFEATSSGLARAKRRCVSNMVDIIRAVEGMSISFAQTVKKFAEMSYEEAIEFRERLPKMRSIAPSNNNPDTCGHEQLFVDIGKVVVQVLWGYIATITMHYTNGLCTVFGPRRPGGKLFELELNTAQEEKIISCSLETGRVMGVDGDCPPRVTAMRLSTNRCSVLVAQAGNWKSSVNGQSDRASMPYKDLQMTCYDQPMANGHIVGFWGQADSTEDFGLCRLAPIWGNMYAKPNGPTAIEPINKDQPEHEHFPSGVWDTLEIHDWQTPVQRTQGVIEYNARISGNLLPNILVGVRKLQTWGNASMRFDAVTESVTSSGFAIGVEQWSNSLFYEGEFTWIGIPPGLHDIQAGNFKCHSSSAQRIISFSKPFHTPPWVLTWISGLDLRLKEGQTVDVEAEPDTSNTDFVMRVTGMGTSIKYATVSWIAVHHYSPCLIGNICASIGEDEYTCGYCNFPEGKFTAPPTVLAAFSAFDLGGPAGTNPRFGTCTWNETENGFNWKVYRWGDSVIRSATISYLAIPAQ